MIRSEVRARVAANQPDAAMGADGADGTDGQATQAAAAPPPQVDRPAVAPGRGRPPWLVRNSRKAMIALVLATLAISLFAYLYLQREFGPDPLAGIKLDGVKFDAITDISEGVKPTEVRPADAKPTVAKPFPAAGPIEPAPTPLRPRRSASPTGSVAASPVAPSLGVTHTRPAVAAPVTLQATPPAAGARDTLEKNAGPRANASEEQTVSRACTEAVAALGLCDPNANLKGK